MRKCSISAFSHFLIFALSYSHILTLHSAPVQQGYTNHAGNVIAGWPVKLTATHVSLSEEVRGKSEEVGAKREEASSLPAPRSSLLALFSPLLALPSFHLPRIGAAAHRGGFRRAAASRGGEAGDRGCGEGDGAVSQTGGEGALHEGGERSVLREIADRTPQLSRQAG